MYFKKLELIGFKSFCDKTTLHFEPGITAVVGPNGTGKSNIFDSIRWVLGEQSAKSLRGSDMQDVIFNGTDQKEPLGMAEVTLTFDNQNRFLNIDHDEVAITRRLFRSGESEYLLNKTNVRLKDILDILLGTGVGAESYSIVAQGKIDLVLSSRPEDRRLVFDEASGITKYKAQKRETMRKLDETEQNLLRVNDIVTEVKRQIGSLERQANKARRYKEVFEELKSKELRLAFLEKKNLLGQKDQLIKQLSDLEEKESVFINLVREAEQKISNRQAELRELENKMMEARNQILNLENLVVRNNEHIAFNKERTIELESNRNYLQEQLKQTEKKLLTDKEKFNKVKYEFDNISGQIEGKSKVLSERQAQINELASSIKTALELIAKSKKDILDMEAGIAGAKNQVSDYTAKRQIYEARKKRLDIEKAKVFEEKAITEESLSNISAEVGEIKKVLEGAHLKIALVKDELEQERLSLDSLNAEITEVEKQRLTLQSHKDFLEKLKTKYQDLGESRNAVVYLDKAPEEEISGLVIKIKERLNLNEDDKGIAQSLAVKLSGEAKPIELDTTNISEKINDLERKLDTLKEEKRQKEAHIEEINKAMQGLQDGLRSQEIIFANKETSRQTILEQFNKIKEEEDIILLELQDVAKEILVLENNLDNCQKELSGWNKKKLIAQDAIAQYEEKISQSSESREELLIIITQTKTELDGLKKQIASDEATLSILEDTYKQDQQNLENLQQQIDDSSSKREMLEAEIKDCECKIMEFSSTIEIQGNALREAEDTYKQASEGTSDVTRKIDSDRKELDSIKKSLYELQMKGKDIDYKFTSISERMLQAYRVDLEGCQEDIAAEEPSSDDLNQQIDDLKSKLNSYGSVNLVAIEEYDELKKRYDFLIQQQDDLFSAKDSLHQAISKINRTTKQMFLETFEQVRLEFRNYFKLLFNGGDAQVYLIDEQDPLESGIEIICRPPGKKLQNVLLLSGGEKSMSAIALIFAIFKVRPSPFCVLDEIDAALDEANIDRFSRVLQEFAKQSQFIVITHNKKTIVNASVMYGITMEHSGISKIVSVKFAESKTEDKDFAAEAV